MILLALRHELSATARSAARLGVLIVFILASAYAILSGQHFRSQWTEALAVADAQQAETVASAREWLANGMSGPEDRPWVDITAPLWQDWYAGSRMQRTPSSLAGIAAGAVDESPVVMRVHRLANPFDATGIRLENPELDSTQAIDLVFVFVMWIPIVVSVMGVGIGGFEREHGMERLIAVQSGTAAMWFLARAMAVTAITAGVVLGICVAAAIGTGAAFADAAQLAGLACLYTFLWGGVLAAVGATAGSMRESALAYGLVWALVCILVPSLLAERALSRAGAEYELEASLGARAERYAAYEREVDEILPELYEAFPNLTTLPAADLEELPPAIRRHAYDGVLLLALERRHALRRTREEQAETALLRAAWLSPAIALSHGFEQLAGRGSSATSDFRDRVVGSIRARLEWVLEHSWLQQPLDAEDFDALVDGHPSRFEAASTFVNRQLFVLAAWSILAWVVGFVRLLRLEQAAQPQVESAFG